MTIQDALDYLTKFGFTGLRATHMPPEIRGGLQIIEHTSDMSVYVNPFSILAENEVWLLRTSGIGQFNLEISFMTLAPLIILNVLISKLLEE